MRLTRPGATKRGTRTILTSPRSRHRRYWWHEPIPDVVGDRQALVGGAPRRQDPRLVPGAVGAGVGSGGPGARWSVPRDRHRHLGKQHVVAADGLRAHRDRLPGAGHGADVL